MDLPYREILAACEKSRSEGLTGDRLLSDGRFFQKLYQKPVCAPLMNLGEVL